MAGELKVNRPRVWAMFHGLRPPLLPTEILDPRVDQLRRAAGRDEDHGTVSWDSTGAPANYEFMWGTASRPEADTLAAKLRSVAKVEVQVQD